VAVRALADKIPNASILGHDPPPSCRGSSIA
jgi:hypothetical protein